ncbi:alpha/beta fold hydrolase [Flavobacterium soyangense]|uniref:Alpha/beta fold hydrolase n=1 Tax=Flavobacterium soyangense TaxID=2023265 RepID=A0A930UCV0_9FLAO|nr:alpha/beta fold hydrolase [Flavobacterium soyangense]MBF2708070.1 alpha/beta fold hydrolase [Flavobacterium soyangense]
MAHLKVLRGYEGTPKVRGFFNSIQGKFKDGKLKSTFFKFKNPIDYQIKNVEGVDIFYKEAGQKTKPSLVLLHGFSTSSYFYNDLINRLSNEYHIIAPDYPGFGDSEKPSFTDFEYTLENYAKIFSNLLSDLNIRNYSLYLMDSGIPLGLYMENLYPEKIKSLIIQSDCSHKDVSEACRNLLYSFWKNKVIQNKVKVLDNSLCVDGSNLQCYYEGFKSNSSTTDNFGLDLRHLWLYNIGDINLALFYDYQNFLKMSHY